MPTINDNQTLRQLDAFNNWLNDTHGSGTNLDTLLYDIDFSDKEIDHLKQRHLSEILQSILNLLDSYPDLRYELNAIMVQHYGLRDGIPQDFYAIAPQYGVCGERIKQLVHMRLVLYREPLRQLQFKNDLAEILSALLRNEDKP
ncbi:MAG: hypothetical protein AAF846_14790 [Chloroflexota bacterium]